MHATVEECSPLNISKTSTWEHCFDLAAQHHQYWQSMHMFLEESQNGVHTQADIVWWGTCSVSVIRVMPLSIGFNVLQPNGQHKHIGAGKKKVKFYFSSFLKLLSTTR